MGDRTWGTPHQTVKDIRDIEARNLLQQDAKIRAKQARKPHQPGVDLHPDAVKPRVDENAKSNAQQAWEARRLAAQSQGHVPVEYVPPPYVPKFVPAAELTGLQAYRGNKLFELMDENTNGRLEPSEITKFFGTEFADTEVPEELIEAVKHADEDGRLSAEDFLLFLADYKANHGNDELDAFVAYCTRKASPELTKQELMSARSLFQEIDTNGSGTLEQSEMANYYHAHWPQEVFPVQLIAEEAGHVSIDAWIQFLADIKRTQGNEALASFLAGRELNFEIKSKLLPHEPVAPYDPATATHTPYMSPPTSPSLSGRPYDAKQQGSPVKTMTDNPELTRVVEALLVAYPSMGKNMIRRQLNQDHPHLSTVSNETLSAVILGCKAKMHTQLSGLTQKDRECMCAAVGLTVEDLAAIESRALGFFTSKGYSMSIVSSKTQVSSDGEVHQQGLHASIVYQRTDPDWPSFIEQGTAIFHVKKPGTYDWVDNEKNEDWVVEPLMRGVQNGASP